MGQDKGVTSWGPLGFTQRLSYPPNSVLRIDNSRYGPFCSGRGILRVVLSLLRYHIYTIFHIEVDFRAYLMVSSLS